MAATTRRWSAEMTRHSDAHDIKKNTFAREDPAARKAKDELRKLYSKKVS